MNEPALAIVSRLTKAELRKRLDQIDAERRAIKILLRAVATRENGHKGRELDHADQIGKAVSA